MCVVFYIMKMYPFFLVSSAWCFLYYNITRLYREQRMTIYETVYTVHTTIATQYFHLQGYEFLSFPFHVVPFCSHTIIQYDVYLCFFTISFMMYLGALWLYIIYNTFVCTMHVHTFHTHTHASYIVCKMCNIFFFLLQWGR